MKLRREAEALLLKPPSIGRFVPDEHEVDAAEFIKTKDEVDAAEVGILGVPFDTAVVLRRGCRFGPDGVRQALMNSTSYEPGIDVDLSSGLQVVDFGDVDVLHTDVLKTHERIETVVTELFRSGVFPLIIGGDHSIAFPHIKSLCRVTQGQVGIIHFDAHLDLRTGHHGEISSGTPFRRALEELEGQVEPENLVQVGINGWHNSAYYMNYAREQGIRVIPGREVHDRGIHSVIEEALGRAARGVDAVFFTVDIDCLDIPWAPGTSCPNPGGLTMVQLLEAVYTIVQHPLVKGFDLVEVAPPLDIRDVTSYSGAALVMQCLGGLKRRKDKRGSL